MTKFRAAVSVGIAAIVFVCPAVAQGPSTGSGQAYPSRPVRVVVPFAPGGPNDIIVRLVAQKLGESLGQPFLVENRAGAGGNIGTDYVAKSAPDGYTLLSVGPGSLIINPLMGKVAYDTQRDFAPVTLMAKAPNALVVHPSLPVSSVKELIALARARPGAINYGSGGNGSTPHLSAALFAAMAGVTLTHVPYKGSAPATADLIGGQVQVAFLGIPAVLPHVKSGKLRVLAVTGLSRSPELPEVPTVDESGVPGYEVSPWYGLLAPAGTPREIVARLAGEATSILRAAQMKEKLAAQGAEAAGGTPEQYAAVIRADAATWARVIESAGLRGDQER
ncbi:MAG TPA: tripartite tricarboxylate transporter substrate binding protein [Burkholderiales bacterium]|nr:tripartite tricarboxylate transporter substrate binding protein [Burkholderiales bacterium]